VSLAGDLRHLVDLVPAAWLLALAALAGVLEALPLIGLVVPANTFVFLLALHWAVAPGHRDWDLFAAFTVGSFAGDLLAFAGGRRLGLGFMERAPGILRLGPERRAALERLVHLHGGKAFLLARLQPFSRSFAPYVAGAARLQASRFAPAGAIASAILCGVVVLGGWLSGIGLAAVGHAIGGALAFAVGAIAVLAVLYLWLTRKLRVVTGTTLGLATLGAMGLGAFLGLLVDAARRGHLATREARIWPRTLAETHAWGSLANVVATLTDARVVAVALVALAVGFALRRRMGAAALSVAAGPALLVAALAVRTALPRMPPTGAAKSLLLGTGFPDPAPALAVSFAAVCAWLLLRQRQGRWARRIVVAAAVLVSLVALAADLLAGRSWPTEALGGAALGAAWSALCLLGDTWLAWRARRRMAAGT